MKFKHGDKVTCKISGKLIKDAKISINEYGEPFICQNECDGADTYDKLGYKYSWGLTKDFTVSGVKNLKLIKKDISDITTYEVGDVLVNKDGNEKKVLGICGKVVFTSRINSFSNAGSVFTVEELISDSYSFKTPTPEPTEEETKAKNLLESLGYKIEK